MNPDNVRLPAIFLMIVAGINTAILVLYVVVYSALGAIVVFAPAQQGSTGDEQLIAGGVMGFYTLIFGLGVVWNVFIGWAGWNMFRTQKHTIALVGAILAVIPCFNPCCFLGIPIGIWSIVVLNDPNAKAMFQTS